MKNIIVTISIKEVNGKTTVDLNTNGTNNVSYVVEGLNLLKQQLITLVANNLDKKHANSRFHSKKDISKAAISLTFNDIFSSHNNS